MTTQVTLLSLYGEKNPALAEIIGECQELVAQALGAAFTAYDLRQIHATIIGLNRSRPPVFNANFAKHRGEDVAMDLAGFLAYLRGCGGIPFTAQLGGFGRRDVPFRSRGATPYERSFSVQGDKVVMMGWPVQTGSQPTSPASAMQSVKAYPPTLERIRHAAQRYGILHNYHRTLSDADNDLYFRIGLVDAQTLPDAAIGAVETQVREYLGARRPVVFEVGFEDVFIAAFDDARLPLSTTRTWSLAERSLTGDFVAGLFA